MQLWTGLACVRNQTVFWHVHTYSRRVSLQALRWYQIRRLLKRTSSVACETTKKNSAAFSLMVRVSSAAFCETFYCCIFQWNRLVLDCFLCLFWDEEHNDRDCVCACGINQQKPSTMRPLPETARSHPHVADGNRAFSVCFFTAKQMVTMANRLQRAKRRSLVSNCFVWAVTKAKFARGNEFHALALSDSCLQKFAFAKAQTHHQSTNEERERSPARRQSLLESLCVRPQTPKSTWNASCSPLHD